MVHWIRLSLLYAKVFQTNRKIRQQMSRMFRLLCMHKILVHAQDSCACTRFLCMHNTLVHAQYACACSGGARDQALDPKRQRSRARDRARPGPWPLQCMHKSVVHAQEWCACTRILCMHKNLVHAQESRAQS